jgi:DNA-binding SARP family transcriptional activator
MRIEILGRLSLRSDAGEEIKLSGEKPRVLLRLLAANRGQPLPVDAITEGLWGENPPRSAAANLQTYASRVRNALGHATAGGACRLTHEAGSYLLALDDDECDLLQFERLTTAGRSAVADNPALAARMLRHALGLWRGVPLPSAVTTRSTTAAGKLLRWEEMRLSAYSDLVDVTCATGDPSSLVPELRQLVAENPLRERVHELLVRVLYLSGDAAMSLAAYQDTRTTLIESLGTEPGSRLRRMYQAILRGDPLDVAG